MKIISLFLAVLCLPGMVQANVGTDYIGSRTCAGCHQVEFEAWKNSHHDLAMQPATEKTVLGDFNETGFEYNGTGSRFFRDGDRFMVETDGPDGMLQIYPVAYTFGVTPLQQYLIEFPGGRLQALGIAWDSRPKTEGGQRWFHLYPDQDVDRTHELHWTRLSQTWNHQCAECHSTGLKKNYDIATRSYETSWQEIDVSCEACHGPGKPHLDWAEAGGKEKNNGLDVIFDERRGVHWNIDLQTGNAKRSTPRTSSVEIELCARCHSRRGLLSEDYRHGEPLTRTHRPALLGEGLYFADGQIEDEVYVYGSFLQSKMHQAGVTCSDCHEPHSNALRTPGNGVCLQCHVAARFDTPEHHHHPADSTGASCAECHMPTKTYMVVDPRHDHSFRIPRPDLSKILDTPNACNNCHTDKNVGWAVQQTRQWYPEGTGKGYQTYGVALREGRRDGPNAAQLLNQLAQNEQQPAIARATAVSLLPRHFNRQTFATLQQSLASEEPLIRMAAVGSLENLPGEMRAALLSPLLADPERAVRIEAARALADAPRTMLDAAVLDTVLEEYIDSQLINADRIEALMNLGNLSRGLGQNDRAEDYLKQAIDLEADFAPAYVNLADLYRVTDKQAESLAILQQGLQLAPQSADLHHALGLARIRSGDRTDALASLTAAARLAPENPRYAFVYAVALNSMEQKDEAIRVLELSLHRHPTDRDTIALSQKFVA